MDVLADLPGDGEVAEMLVCVRLLYPLVLGSPVLHYISKLKASIYISSTNERPVSTQASPMRGEYLPGTRS